ncbi:MAG: VOC family protein [Cyclobacteriaceae bacterium]
MIIGLDHPAIAADDLEKLSTWYCDVLDYELVMKSDEKPVWIIKSPDGTFMEMMQKDENARPGRTILTAGISHLAFRVADLHQAIEDLDKAGVQWLSDIVPAIGGGKLRTFADPEGNVLQIVDRNA